MSISSHEFEGMARGKLKGKMKTQAPKIKHYKTKDLFGKNKPAKSRGSELTYPENIGYNY